MRTTDEGEDEMKKAITILALILMIFAVSCSNDTPTPANEVPQKADLTIAKADVPEADDAALMEAVTKVSGVIQTLASGSPDEAATPDYWSNYYDEDGQLVYVRDKGVRYLAVDGEILRAGDVVYYYSGSQGQRIIEVNNVRYSSDTADGKALIEDYNDLCGTVVTSVHSEKIENVYTLTEGEGDAAKTYTITLTGSATVNSDNEYVCQVDVAISPAYGEGDTGVTSISLNAFNEWVTPEVAEGAPIPTPALEPRCVLTVGADSYNAYSVWNVSVGMPSIETILRSLFAELQN